MITGHLRSAWLENERIGDLQLPATLRRWESPGHARTRDAPPHFGVGNGPQRMRRVRDT